MLPSFYCIAVSGEAAGAHQALQIRWSFCSEITLRMIADNDTHMKELVDVCE